MATTSPRTPRLWYDDVSEGDALPPLVKNPDTRQLVMYAGASGDFVPIHYDRDVAQAAGHDRVIIHGALKSAWLAELVTKWIGHSGRLLKLSVQYRGIDYPGETLTCRGTVKLRRIENGLGIVDLEIALENGVGEITTPGTATVALPVRATIGGQNAPRHPDRSGGI